MTCLQNRTNKHRKITKSKDYVTRIDPEEAQRIAEKAENEKLKARRKLEAKRRSAYEADMQDVEYESGEDMYRRGDTSLLNHLNDYKDELGDGFGIDSLSILTFSGG